MTNELPQTKIAERFKLHLLRIETLLGLGVIFHILFTLSVFFAGKYMVFPNWILSNGNLPEDATRNLEKIVSMSGEISSGSLRPLFAASESIDQRLYTISHFLTSGLVGNNILSFELLNVLIYIAILYLVFRIGETLFESRVGIISGYTVMVFPSLTLHTTQPLGDPLFLAVFLLFLFLIIELLKESFELPKVVVWLCKSVPVFLLMWFVRDRFYFVFLAVILAAFFFVLLESAKNRWQFKFNSAALLLLFCVAIVTPNFLSSYVSKKGDLSPTVQAALEERTQRQESLLQPAFLAKINKMRDGFLAEYSSAGSNIDTEVTFDDVFALVVYIPRALSVGLFSPFPNEWPGVGLQYGKTGRLLAGAETALVYILMLLATIAVIIKRNTAIFFVTSTIFAGTIALGLVVPNIGALYRMRYIYWLLIICLGIGGAFELKKYILKKREKPEPGMESAVEPL